MDVCKNLDSIISKKLTEEFDHIDERYNGFKNGLKIDFRNFVLESFLKKENSSYFTENYGKINIKDIYRDRDHFFMRRLCRGDKKTVDDVKKILKIFTDTNPSKYFIDIRGVDYTSSPTKACFFVFIISNYGDIIHLENDNHKIVSDIIKGKFPVTDIQINYIQSEPIKCVKLERYEDSRNEIFTNWHCEKSVIKLYLEGISKSINLLSSELITNLLKKEQMIKNNNAIILLKEENDILRKQLNKHITKKTN